MNAEALYGFCVNGISHFHFVEMRFQLFPEIHVENNNLFRYKNSNENFIVVK